eukprot:5580754-Prymnesium_polylepis.1
MNITFSCDDEPDPFRAVSTFIAIAVGQTIAPSCAAMLPWLAQFGLTAVPTQCGNQIAVMIPLMASFGVMWSSPRPGVVTVNELCPATCAAFDAGISSCPPASPQFPPSAPPPGLPSPRPPPIQPPPKWPPPPANTPSPLPRRVGRGVRASSRRG